MATLIPILTTLGTLAGGLGSLASAGVGIASAAKGAPKSKVPVDLQRKADEKRQATQAALVSRGLSATVLTPAGGPPGVAATSRATLLGQ